jgi:multiple sugar transport system permease protein
MANRPVSSMTRKEWKRLAEGLLFISPWIVGFLWFTFGPLLTSAGLSFFQWDLLTKPKWIGFGNYGRALQEPLFWQSLKVTVIYTLCSVPIGIVAALVLAIMLNQPIRGRVWFRSIFYLPAIMSGVAVSVLWKWMFNPQFGLINYLLGKIGIRGPAWLSSPQWALPALIVMSLWGTGSSMIIYLAGLQGIPTQLYEAAEIDGAGTWAKFWVITIPMLTPTIFFTLIMGIINSFQVFTQAYVMTGGGPQYATHFFVLYIYENAFRYFKMGYASSLAWVLFVIVMVLTVIQFRLAPKWVYYESDIRRQA